MYAQASRPESVANGRIQIVEDFITAEERQVLCAWAAEMFPFLKPNRHGKERFYQQVQNLPVIPYTYHLVRQRVEQWLGVQECDREPEVGWFLGSIGEGGFVHEHIDRAPPAKRHLRGNLFIQTPESGGEPVINGVVQPFRERMLLCFFPSELRHRSEPVQGPVRRITCSFGYVVPTEYRLASAHLKPTAGSMASNIGQSKHSGWGAGGVLPV
jgi:hypothetical protein